MKMIFLALVVLAFAMLFFATYVRLAPSNPDVWHVAPVANGAAGEIQTQSNGATLLLSTATLAQIDAVAMASPRTKRLAGSLDEGRITWITRSAIWGFPDYTTAEATAEGIKIHARLRFGKSDLGVNAARLRDWQSKF
jgi:hypothetical protein